MKLLREYINEVIRNVQPPERRRPTNQQLVVPAKILDSDSGEYRTEPHWRDFRKLPKEEQLAWAEKHFAGGIRKPLDVRVYADGSLMFSDGHHRAMAAKLLDEEIPIVIKRNQLQEKSAEFRIFAVLGRQRRSPGEVVERVHFS